MLGVTDEAIYEMARHEFESWSRYCQRHVETNLDISRDQQIGGDLV